MRNIGRFFVAALVIMALIWVSKECSGENAKDQALKEHKQ